VERNGRCRATGFRIAGELPHEEGADDIAILLNGRLNEIAAVVPVSSVLLYLGMQRHERVRGKKLFGISRKG
jgi:hypothetical protein